MPKTETTSTTWQEKQAAMPDPVGEALTVFEKLKQSEPYDRMAEAIETYEAALVLCQQCDEPGCTATAGIGYPLKDGIGYRRTCHKHCDMGAV